MTAGRTGRPENHPSVDWASLRSVLIHKPDRLGDACCAAPAVSLIRRAAPKAEIHVAAPAVSGELFRVLGCADAVHELPGPAWWKSAFVWNYIRWARARRFDLVVNLRHDVRDIFLSRFFGARMTATYDHKGWGRFAEICADAPSEERAETDNHLRVAESLGLVNEPPFRAVLPVEAEAFAEANLPSGKRWAAFHPFARTQAKTWDGDKAAELAGRLTDAGFSVVLVGGKEHASAATALAEKAAVACTLAGKTTVAQLLAVLARSEILITTDSAPGHAAALMGTRTVSIMSGTNLPARWTPKGATALRREVSCAPCALENCNVPGHPCLSGIGADEVFKAAMEVLSR